MWRKTETLVPALGPAGGAGTNILSIRAIGARMGCVCDKIGGCGFQVSRSKILGARMGCVCDKIGGDAGTKISSYKILGARMGCGGGVCGYQDQALSGRFWNH